MTQEKKSLDEQNKLWLKLKIDLETLKNATAVDLKDHFDELKELKKILAQSAIKLENITWFLNTDIFDLIFEVPEEFSVSLLTIYKVLLSGVESFSKDLFQEHVQVLLDRKNEENRGLLALIKKEKNEKNRFFPVYKEEAQQHISMISSFFSILYAQKEKKRTPLEGTNPPREKKLLRTLSPLALTDKHGSSRIDAKYQESLFRSSSKRV